MLPFMILNKQGIECRYLTLIKNEYLKNEYQIWWHDGQMTLLMWIFHIGLFLFVAE